MSEMVERVARAICAKEMRETGSRCPTDGNCSDCCYSDTARAAIAAMREPTRTMHDDGGDVELSGDFEESSKLVTSYDAKRVWQAMIDAALRNQ